MPEHHTPQAWYRKLHWQVAVGMVVGLLLGLFGGEGPVPWYGWIGELFLRLLKMVVVPLIVASIVVGVARLGHPRAVGRLGIRTLVYYLSTSSLAILTGLLFVNLFRPGDHVDLAALHAGDAVQEYGGSIKEILLDIVPENPIGAMAEFGSGREGSGKLIGVIFFCILFGLGTATLDDRRRETVLRLFDGAFQIMMRITDVVIRLAPVAVASLMGSMLAQTGSDILLPLAGYMATVLAGLAVHFFISIPLIIRVFARRNPLAYFQGINLAPATAFSTASSNATLPVSLDVACRQPGIDSRVAGFVLPLGATVNMDGTALYEGVAALFIAQAYGYDLGVTQQFLVFVTALLTSIGAAGIPHASLVMMTIVFQAVGLPLEAIGILFGVDRILDMCRTATNVWSDLGGAAVVSAGRTRCRDCPGALHPDR